MGIFRELFGRGVQNLIGRLGQAAVLHRADGSATISLNVVFNEQVGFVDDRRRGVFFIDSDDVSDSLNRGDYFILDGETDRFTVVDVRDSKDGAMECRCDGTLTRL